MVIGLCKQIYSLSMQPLAVAWGQICTLCWTGNFDNRIRVTKRLDGHARTVLLPCSSWFQCLEVLVSANLTTPFREHVKIFDDTKLNDIPPDSPPHH